MSRSHKTKSSKDQFEIRVGRKYRLGKKVGSGSFGDIYLGTHVENATEVAIKLEPSSTRHPQLKYESRLYNLLKGAVGIPDVKWYGVEGDYNVMVMDLLGPSLEDLFCYCGRNFSVKTVCLLGEQLVTRLEYLHNKNYLHRDIKPDNFLVGVGGGGSDMQRNSSSSTSKMKNGPVAGAGPGGPGATVYMIDFGLAKRYRDSRHTHIPYRDKKSLTGTARYASINTHLGLEQSRRDDLESTGYVLMYFLRGSLPWQGLRAPNKKVKYQKICAKKLGTPLEKLCSQYPEEFSMYLSYCRGLRFDETPNYDYLRRLFHRCAARNKFSLNDYMFDWTTKSNKSHKKKQVKNSGTGGGGSGRNGRSAGGVEEKVATQRQTTRSKQGQQTTRTDGDGGGAAGCEEASGEREGGGAKGSSGGGEDNSGKVRKGGQGEDEKRNEATPNNTSKEASGASGAGGKGIRQRGGAGGDSSEKRTTAEGTAARAPTSGELPPFMPPTILKTPTETLGNGGVNNTSHEQGSGGGGAEVLSSAGAHGAPSSHSADPN